MKQQRFAFLQRSEYDSVNTVSFSTFHPDYDWIDQMKTRWGLSYIGYLAKKNLDVFDKRVVYKLAVLTAAIVAVVVLLALLF